MPSTSQPSPVTRYLILPGLLMLWGVGLLPAQEQEPAPQAVVDSQPTPTVINSSNISRQAQADLTVLESLQQRGNLVQVLERLTREIADNRSVMDTLQSVTDAELTNRQSMGRLETLRSQWNRVDGKWESLSNTLRDRTGELQSDLDSIGVIRTRWQVTRDSVAGLDLPGALQNRIDEVLGGVAAATDTTRSHLNTILTLEDQVTQASADSKDELQVIDQALGAARVRIVARDSRTLWSLLLHPPRDTPLFEQGQNLFSELWLGAVVAVEKDADSLVLHLLLTLALLAWMVTQSFRSRAWSTEDEGMLVARQVLGRPGAAALLLSMLAVRVTIPGVPSRFVDLLTLLAVFPLYRLLPRMIPRSLRPALYTFFGVFLFAIFVELLEPYSVVWRLALLVSNLLGAWALWFALRVQPGATLHRSNWRRAFRKLGYLVAIALGISFVGNILGFTGLAHFLLRGTYLATYYILLLFAMAMVLEAMWVALLRMPTALRSNAIRRHTRLLQRRGVKIVRVLVAAAWMAQLLDIFGVFVPVVAWFGRVLSYQVRFGDIGISLGGVVGFVVTLWAAFAVSRFIRFLLEEDVMTRVDLPRGVPRAINIIIHYVLVILAFLLAVSAAGVDLGKLTILAGAFGLGIGFGLQNIINNFVSGLILLFERPIQIDDTVEVGTLIGQVKRIGIRSSTVRSYTGAEVIVPNANLVSNEVINWTLSDRKRRLTVAVGVAYGTDPELVLETLCNVAAAHEKVMDDPAPWALFTGFGESSLDFEIRFWVLQFEDGMQVASDVSVGINRALADASIEIPFPQRDLHIKSNVASAVVPEPTTESEGA